MGILHGLTLGLAAALAWPALALADCAPGRADLRGAFGTAQVSVEIAATPAEQARGLMFRESLPTMAGMLFVYPDERDASFWMRNTLIPLDMVFLDEAGRVVRIHENAVPLDETPIRAGVPTLAVLELNGGLARRLGLRPGDEIRSPAMPQDLAAWPCD